MIIIKKIHKSIKTQALTIYNKYKIFKIKKKILNNNSMRFFNYLETRRNKKFELKTWIVSIITKINGINVRTNYYIGIKFDISKYFK
jgi:hypothetical protein